MIKDQMDWGLSPEQLAFMQARDSEIEEAYRKDDDGFFIQIISSDDWGRLFGEMSWDEAYDRYEFSIGRSES